MHFSSSNGGPDLTFTGSDGVPHHLLDNVSEGKMMIFGFFLALMVLCLSSIRYTLWGVVSTLAMVEEPQYTYRVRIEKSNRSSAEATAQEVQEADAEVSMVKDKPITSKIRSTIAHLHRRAGYTSRWRGLTVFIIYALAHTSLKSSFTFALRVIPGLMPMLAGSVGSIVASIVLAPLSTAWVHIVISEPSPKRWWHRIPAPSSWKHLWAPSATVDAVTRLAFILPTVCGLILGLDHTKFNEQHVALTCFKILVCGAIGLLTMVSLVIPSIVVLVRIQASMLPEEDEAIVPFDRTFGGKVVPEIVGGSGVISFVDAWKTFGMAARARIVKLFFKFIFIEIFFHIFYATCLLILGAGLIGFDNIRRFIKERTV